MSQIAWDDKTNEELCIEYQETKSDKLFEYFLKRNKAIIYAFFNPYIIKFPERTDEFEQCGRMAMWRTMQNLDTTKGQFSTYFFIYARRELNLNYQDTFMVRLPRYVFSNGVLEQYKNDVNLITSIESLDTVVYIDERGLEYSLKDFIIDSGPGPDALMIENTQRDYVEKLLKCLSPKEKKILRLRFGLGQDDNGPRSLQEIGDEFGITRERIRQIEKGALWKLKKVIERQEVKS